MEPYADSKNLQRVKYTINLYQGEFISKTELAIQVSFGGVKVKFKIISYFSLRYTVAIRIIVPSSTICKREKKDIYQLLIV